MTFTIKLISPKMSLRPMDSELKRAMSPSLALMVLAALTPEKYNCYIEDENVSKLNLEDYPNLVGISVNTDTAYRAYEIAKIYRNKGIKVILGGIHASVYPEEGDNYADSICIGEAEELWPTIVEDAVNNKLKHRYFNDQPTDLSYVPIPKRNLIDQNKYLYTNIIFTSRGCPFKCEFCYNSCNYIHKIYRNRPIENVITEIKSLNSNHVMFIDDNFIGNPIWTKEFLQTLKSLNIKWNTAVSANLVNHPDLLDLMKESGCQSLFIGFETINKKAISDIQKHQNNVELYEKLIQEIHNRDIMINASLVFGFDTDTKNVFLDTLSWLIKNKIETMTAHILTPYPGTELFKKFQDENRIMDFNWKNYNTSKVIFKPALMTSDELYNGYIWIYNEFYSIRNILKRMPENKKQRKAYILFNLGYRKFGMLTSSLAKFGLMNKIGSIASRIAYS